MKDEVERIWKEEVVASSKYLIRRFDENPSSPIDVVTSETRTEDEQLYRYASLVGVKSSELLFIDKYSYLNCWHFESKKTEKRKLLFVYTGCN
jgi:hypothetical protein